MEINKPILNAIEQFSQTVLEPGAWPAALDAAVRLLGGDHAVLVANHQSTAMLPFSAFAGLDARDRERFVSPLAMRLVVPFEKLLIPGVVSSPTDWFSDPEFERSEFYNEILRPANGYYSATVRHDLENLTFHLSICRSRRGGAFTANETQQLDVLLPHVTAALDLRRRLDVSEHQARGFAQALHSLTEGVIVLDGAGRPIIVNARAEKILQQGDGLAFGSGRLRASLGALTSKLLDAIAVASASETTTNQQIYLPRLPPRLPLLLTVIPISQLRAEQPGLGMPRVLILVKEPDARSEVDRVALEDIFRLTPRESEIAALLADGASAREIAGRLELTVGTVRFNIKRIFQKTATHSQTALVVLVRQFSREHRPPRQSMFRKD
jgi:DNA-binding CsgD family transcriptional regulator/PAS domain-containing protein